MIEALSERAFFITCCMRVVLFARSAFVTSERADIFGGLTGGRVEEEGGRVEEGERERRRVSMSELVWVLLRVVVPPSVGIIKRRAKEKKRTLSWA